MDTNLETNEVKTERPPAESESYKKIVDDSKAKVLEAKEMTEMPRRGRGRPRKVLDKPIEEKQTAAPLGDLTSLIESPLLFISKIPAAKYDMPELALSPDEAKMCAESLNQLANAFVPDLNKVDPKTAAIFNVCATFGALGFQKYTIYLDKKQTKIEEQKKQAPKEEENRPVQSQGTPAENYFSRRQV